MAALFQLSHPTGRLRRRGGGSGSARRAVPRRSVPVGEIVPGGRRPGRLDLASSLHPPNALMKNAVYALSPQAITDAWVGPPGRPTASRDPRRGGAPREWTSRD